MQHEHNPKSIKYHVKRLLERNADQYRNKTVIDFPAGNGITSRILKQIGAKVEPMDLFPEYFEVDDLACKRADISKGLPAPDAHADILVCQEGIEHFPDQLAAFKEMNRVLKAQGTLILTTPNYSNLRARLSYLLSESERFNSIMPPNELDSIWMSKQELSPQLYYGHIFLIGVQKLRVLAKLAGFRIRKIHFTRARSTSLLLLPLLYPFILLSNWFTYQKNMHKQKAYSKETKRQVYGEIFKLSINPKILVDGHLMVEFEKEMEAAEVAGSLQARDLEFGET